MFSLTHTQDNVMGTVSITGDDCLTTGDIAGTVSGVNARLTVQSGGESITLNANADSAAKTLNGTWSYNASALGCADETGKFSTTLTSGEADIDW